MNKSIAVVALLATLAACSKPAPPAAPPRPVRTIVIGSGTTTSDLSYSGDVHARHESPLGFRISGKVIERLVDVGTRVSAGQALARLDPAIVALQAELARVQMKQAEDEAKRFRDLRARNFISQSALDAHETALKAAQAQAGISGRTEDYATLRADTAGVIAAVMVEPGQVVAVGAPIVILAKDGEREVVMSLPESALTRFKVGDNAEIRLWADAENVGKPYRGRVREISPAADPVTRTYPARVTIVDADSRVALGMTARVTFHVGSDNGIMIPASAVMQQGEQPAVWVIGADDVVSLRTVKVIAWRDDRALIGDGLTGGERIVESGVHKVHAGEKIAFDKALK